MKINNKLNRIELVKDLVYNISHLFNALAEVIRDNSFSAIYTTT